jgi:hypothetical protein
MKTIPRPSQKQCVHFKIPSSKQRAYWTAIYLASLACGGAMAQTTTNTPPAAPAVTNSNSSTNVTKLKEVDVVGKLDQARQGIVTSIGASVSAIDKAQIVTLPGGQNAKFDELLEYSFPGVAKDGQGQTHVRGEHANLQYRINDVLLPEGITGFGSELSPRFAENVQFLTGSLPAQYGFRTAGVVDIHTRSGVFEPGGQVSMYGGSYDTINPSFEYGGSEGKLNYFVNGSYNHNGIGIENPTSSSTPIHDDTDQYKAFAYMSYLLDDTSRVSTIFSASYSTFQIPNTPGLGVGTDPAGNPWPVPGAPPGSFNSSNLNERQKEQNYYGVVAYQKALGDLNFQLAAFGRYSGVHFMPDSTGDLYFNGVASDVDRSLYSGGLQADLSYALGESHTIRGGVSYLGELATANNNTTVFNVDGAGNAFGAPFLISDKESVRGSFYSAYLQDEWKLTEKFTVNYGARFDEFSSYISENQISPRINGVFKATESTTLHTGYARYFTPPPLEVVRSGSVAQFDGTSNASEVTTDDPVKSERAHYFDAGISQKFGPDITVGVDGYYKVAKNQLDDGLFGQTLILSPFNYNRGKVEGVELTANYKHGGLAAFANLAVSKAQGNAISSAQFLFDPATVAYSQAHPIYLDHDQTLTGSFGVSYLWRHDLGSMLFFADALYGSGLRTDATDALGNTIPNGSRVPPYYSITLGVQEGFKINGKERLKARFEVVNVTDNVYELRDGSGVGINAAQFGERRGFFGSLTWVF